MAKVLSDDELFAVADFVEARGWCEVVTMETVDTVGAVGKAHRLVALGEAMPGDGMFARQLRRKFVWANSHFASNHRTRHRN